LDKFLRVTSRHVHTRARARAFIIIFNFFAPGSRDRAWYQLIREISALIQGWSLARSVSAIKKKKKLLQQCR